MLLGTLGVTSLKSLLTSKDAIIAGKGIFRARQDF